MKLTELPGIGPKTEELYKKAGVEDVAGLLRYFPRDFEIFKEPCAISQIGFNTFAAVKGAFCGAPFTRSSNKKKITTAQFKDEAGSVIRVTWFNAPYIRKQIETGKLYVLRGRVSRKYHTLSLNQPRVYSPEEYEKKVGKMQPVYPTVKGLSSASISRAVSHAMETEEFERTAKEDILPEKIREDLGLMDMKSTIKGMHFPQSREEYGAACRRLSFEEIFLFILTMKKKGREKKKESPIVIKTAPETEEFIKTLPYELTPSQKQAVKEIGDDMASGFLMNRLLTGDVGSGKTIAAFIALMNAAYGGYQGVLMAPTEVLARQHYETLEDFFKKAGTALNPVILTGSMTALEKQVAYDAIEDGRAHIIIGTHAVFQQKVRYKNLGLVITDEQHRFGTNQRKALSQKGNEPHMLVMSATPIPRTLALVLYGDMDVSSLETVPAGRLPVKSAVVDTSYRENAYRFMEKEIRKGHQAYVICPLVEFSEGSDANNVTDYTEMLRDVFPEDISIEMLHGKMPADEKNHVMERFAEGKIQILVSTTVVEVGVDVPNATVILIEDADRFGLSALHQLRGRVGRGKDQSYCILVSSNPSKESKERLEILYYSNNGFEIAQKDLQMRGPGEFFGTRQSGSFNFKYFDEYRDENIAQEAFFAAEGIISGKTQITDEEKERLMKKVDLQGSGIIL